MLSETSLVGRAHSLLVPLCDNKILLFGGYQAKYVGSDGAPEWLKPVNCVVARDGEEESKDPERDAGSFSARRLS